MSEQSSLTKKQLLISGLVCLLLAVIVVVLFVLPAEYKEDPTGFGEATGLASLNTSEELVSTGTVQTLPEGNCSTFNFVDPETTEVSVDEWGIATPVLDGDNHCEHAETFKTETLVINLDFDGSVEYKAVMNHGDVIVYSWTSNQDIYTDMHAHQPDDMEGANPDFFTRYLESESRAQQGSIVAPYDGHHGWYWLNIGDGPAQIELTVSGFFEEIIEIDLDADYGG